MTNSHKNIINPFLESSTLLIMTFPEIVESKDLLWGRTCAVDNVRARRKGVLGKLYEIQISPERGLRNFPAILAWNMFGPGIWARNCWNNTHCIYIYMYVSVCSILFMWKALTGVWCPGLQLLRVAQGPMLQLLQGVLGLTEVGCWDLLMISKCCLDSNVVG